ncbi:MAG: InlB B-repeat-containing protein, partial [Fibrobacter sp.]|nr:InlB B-repeat-containing protein [Fibrobacter sp.]
MRKASGYEKFNLLRSLFLTVAVIFFTASNAAALNKVNGVYQIGSCQDMVDFAKVVNDGSTSANAVVTAPIDMSCSGNFPMIGNGSKKYSGSFNGQGYPISNLKIVGSETQTNVGLFGVISGGSVSNIVLANASISATKPGDAASSLNPINVGVVAGLIENNGSIDKAYASGSITTSGNNQDVGGVVGNLTKGSVKNALSTVSIASNGKSAKIGGVVGENKGTVTQSVYDGKSLNNNGNSGSVGGVVGSGNAATKSYSGLTVNVNAPDKVCVLNGGTWSSGKCNVNGTVWSVGENIVNSGITFSGSTTLVAATFDANGGKFSSGSASLVKGFGIGASIYSSGIEKPTREGFTFAGWALTKNAVEASNDFGNAVKGTTLYAVWKEQLTITFNINSEVAKFPGSVTDLTRKFDLGSKISSESIPSPADYEHEGTSYKFLGWALTSDAGVPANLGVADVAKVVYAVWKETKSTFYKLTFEMGGHGFVPAQNVEAGTRAVKPEEPSAAGYIFDGWYTSNLYNIPFSFVTEITGNTTVYAKWNAVSYTITYHLDGGVNSKLNPSVYTEEYGTILFEPAVKDGFVFEGWFADEEKTIAKNSIPENELGNVVVYAKWRAATYKISYLAGGDGVVGNVAAGEKAHGADYTLSSDVFTRAGYTQSGWSTVAGGNKVYELGATYAENKDLTLYPYWGENGKYSLKYDTTSAAGKTANYLTLMVEAKAPHYLIDVPEKDGYKFGGWKVTKGGVTVSNGKFSMPSTAVVISGKYELINYTVSYETNGAAPIASTTYNVENAVTLPVGVSKTGFTFEGWYDNPYFNGEPVTEIVKGDFGDKTFYAKWQEQPKFNVEYFIFDKIGNLRLYRVDKVAAGDKYTLVNAPDANAGYSFDQWKRVNGENFVPVEASFIMPEGDVKLAGRFIANKYVLTWNFDGGVATGTAGEDYTSDETPVAYLTTLRAPEVTKTGYEFAGWSPAVDKAMPAKNVTYTAIWNPAEVAYKVKYNFQNVSGSEYTLDEAKTVDVNGLTESVIAYEDKCGDGFTLNSAKSETKRIAADGSTVVNVYCDRNVYEAVFKAEDVVLYTAQVRFGATPEYIGSTPTKAATAEKSFVFEGWEPAVDAISGATEYSAKFAETAVKYTLTWNFDGGVVSGEYTKGEVTNGAKIDYPASVTKTGYEFVWNPASVVNMPASDLLLTAVWSPAMYVVTLKNATADKDPVDGKYAYGTELTLTPEAPENSRFTQWSDGIAVENRKVVVTGDAEYVAEFEANTKKLTVTYKVPNGVETPVTVEKFLKVGEDYSVVSPVIEGYTADEPNITGTMAGADVNKIVTYTVNKFSVTYKIVGENFANESFDVKENVAYGSALTPTTKSVVHDGYFFSGWSGLPAKMPNHDVVVTGSYSNVEPESYKVTFKNGDVVLQEKTVAVGNETPAYDGAEPTKAATDKYSYSFKGWSPAIAATVTGNAEYVAEFNETLNRYTIIVTGANVTPAAGEDGKYAYGTTLTLTQNIAAPNHFIKWSDGATAENRTVIVTGDVSYTAEGAVNTHVLTITYKTPAGVTAPAKVVKTFEVGEMYSVASPAIEGYTVDRETVSGTMPDADENVTVNYTPKRFAIELVSATATPAAGEDGKYAYGTTLTLTQAVKAPHHFTKWSDGFASESRTVIVTGDATFAADSAINTHILTITYNVPEGATAPAKVVKTFEVGEVYSIPSPSMVGYTADPSAVSGTMDNENVDVTVNYTANSYTITLNTNGGESLENVVAEYGAAVSVPNASRPGYTFAGWVPAAPATMPAENITLTASWTVNQATITFNTNGGNVIQPIVKDCDAAISAPVAPTKKGYVFAGWYSDEALENPFVFNKMPAEDVTVYAKWVGSERTISLNLNGGTLVDGDENPVNAITGPYGNAVPALGSPTKTGYSFAGWYADTRFTKAYTFTTIPMEDIIVYAKWNVDDFTIKFNSNGGSAVADVKQPFNSILKVPTAPTKTGYEFVGWYSDEALNNAYSFATMPAENITVYAKWEIKQYEIAFETNGGTSVEKIVQDYNSAVVKPAEDPSKTGYTFAGWYADSDLKTVYVFNKMPAENITVYAKWKVKQYTITFVSDGSAVSPITQDFGSAIEAPKAPTKVGHTFKDWEPTLPETMPAENISLTATWTVNVYTITYELNGGDGIASSEHPYGSAVTPPTTPTKRGYVFDGWYAEKALVNKYTFSTMPAKPFKLYAKWAPHETTEYKIARYFQNVNDDGYTLDEDKAQVSEGPTGSMTILEPAGFKGYEGFSLNETKSKAVAIAADGSTTVNVYYDRNEYTVTFKSEGVNFQVASFRYGAEPKFVSDRVPEKKADLTSIYNFVGWEPLLPAKMPAENITVNAVFEDGTKVKYQLVWDFDGGVAEGVAGVNYSAGQVTNGARITYPTKVSMEGHTLTSWIPAGVEYMPTKNLTLKAVWTANDYTITLKGATVSVGGIKKDAESCDENGCVYIFPYGTQLSLLADIPENSDEHFVSWKDGSEAKPIYDNPRKVVVKGDATYETSYGTIYETETDKNFHKLTITYVAPEGVTIPMENVYQYVKNGETYSVESPKIEGYTADKPVVSGTMRDQDVSVTVTYNVNKHKIVYKVTGEYFTDKVYTFEREYGKVLRDDSQLAEMTNDKMVEEGHTFGGWESLLPYKMPDEDIEITGSYTRNSYKLQIVYVLKDGPLRGQYTTSGSYEGRIIVVDKEVLFGDSYSHSVNETFTDRNNVEYTIGVSGNKTVDYTVDRMVVAAEHMPAHDVREVVNFTANKSDILAYYEYGSDGSKNKSYKVEGIPNVYKGNDAITKVDSALKRLYYYPPKPTDESLYLDSILVFDKWSINEDRSVFTPTFKYIKRDEKTVQVSYVDANGDTITVDVKIFEGISADQISQMITDAIKKSDPTNAPKSYSDTYYWHEFIGWKKSGDKYVPDYTHHVRELTVKVVYDEDANPEKTTNVTIRRVDLNPDSALAAGHARDPIAVITAYMNANGYAPEKKSDVQYHYSFVVGTNLYSRPDSINGSWISRPDWTKTLRKYPITFKNGKTDLKTIDVDYGTVPVYDGTLPVKESTTEYSYEFDGWDPDLESVSGPFEYVAKFKPVLRKYKLNYAGAVAEPASADSTYDYGTEVILKAAPEEFHHFTRWSDGVTQEERSVTVDEKAVRYEAVSNPDKFILTIVYTTPNEGRKESHEVMAYGETRNFTSSGIDGYRAVPANFTVTMPGKDSSVAVRYEANSYEISLTNASASIGTGVEKEPKSCDEESNTCVYVFDYGTVLTLTPAEMSNHFFTNWKDGVADSPRTVVVTGDAEYEPVYALNYHVLRIVYSTTTGAEAPKTYEKTLDYGTKYSVTSPELEGHTPDKSVIEETLIADAEYAVVYSPKNYPLTIHYKKAKNGVTVAEDHVSEVAYLSNFSVTSPVVDNYTSDSAIVNGVMNSSVGLEITVTYTGTPYKVIAKYIPKYGSEITEEQLVVVTYDDDHSDIEHAINDALESNDPVIVPQKTYTLTEKFTFNKTWTKGDDGKYTPNFKVDSRDTRNVIAVVNGNDYTTVTIPSDEHVTEEEIQASLNKYFEDRSITPIKASTLDIDYKFNSSWILNDNGKYEPNFNESDRPQITVTAVVTSRDAVDKEYTDIYVPEDGSDAEIYAAINRYFDGKNFDGKKIVPIKASTLTENFKFNETWTLAGGKYTPNFDSSVRTQKTVTVVVNNTNQSAKVPADGKIEEIDEAISLKILDTLRIDPKQASSLTHDYRFVIREDVTISHWKEFDDDIYIPVFDSTARAQKYVVAVANGTNDTISVPNDNKVTDAEINTAINHHFSDKKIKPAKASTLDHDYAFTDTWNKNGSVGELDRYLPIFKESDRPQTKVKVQIASTLHENVNVPTDGTVDEIYAAIVREFSDHPQKAEDRDSTYTFACWTPEPDISCNTARTLSGKITNKTTPFIANFKSTVKLTSVVVAYEKNDTTYANGDQVKTIEIHVPDLKTPSKVLAKVKAAADGSKPSKIGYTFNEWNAYTFSPVKVADFNAVHEALPVNGTAPTNIVYLAGWNINQYTITFDCTGGNIDGKNTVVIEQDYNSDVTAPKSPTRTNYSFDGWDTEIPAKIPAENITIRAKWKKNVTAVVLSADPIYTGSAIAPTITVKSVDGNVSEANYVATWDKDGFIDAGTYTVTVRGKENSEYTDTVSVTATYTIKKADPKITVTMAGWTYGEAAKAPVKSTDFGAAEEPTITYAKKGSSDWSADKPVNAGSYVVKASVANTDNYNYAEKTAEFTISQAPIKIALSASEGTYTGLAHVIPTHTVNSTIGEKLDVTSDANAYDASWNDSSFTNVKTYTITVKGKGNYTGTQTLTYVIKPAPVTVTAVANTKVYGVKDPTFTATVKGLVNGESENLISYTLPRDVGENVGTYKINPTGNKDQGNYTVAYVPNDFTITKDEHNTLSVAMEGWVYSGKADKNPVPTFKQPEDGINVKFHAEGEPTYQYKKDGSEVWTDKIPVDAGSYTVKASVKNTNNYSAVEAENTFTIEKFMGNVVTITLNDNWDYDGKTYAPKTSVRFKKSVEPVIQYAVKKAGDEGYVAEKYVDGDWSTTAPVNQGTYVVMATVEDTDNYNGTTATKVYTINRADVAKYATISAMPSVYYDGNKHAPTVTVTEKRGENALVEGEDKDYTVAWDKDGFTDADTYTVTVTGQGNYTGTKTAKYIIEQAPIQIVLTEKNVYNGDKQIPTVTLKNSKHNQVLVTGDAPSVESTDDYVISWSYKYNGKDSTLADEDWFKHAGVYTISVTGKDKSASGTGNYSGTRVTASYTIDYAPVTVTAVANTKVYGDDDPTLTATIADVVENEKEHAAELIKYTVSRAEGENVNKYTITPMGDEIQGNYKVSYKTAEFSITHAPVVVTAEVKEKVYGIADPELTVKIDGLKRNDPESKISYSIVRDKARTSEGEVVGVYTITPSGEASQGNYSVSYVPATLTVTKSPENSIEVSMDGWTFGQTENSPGNFTKPTFDTTIVKFHGENEPVIEYATVTENEGVYSVGSWSTEKPQYVGIYTVRATVAETRNYVGAVDTAIFKIEAAPIQIVMDPTEVLYNKTVQNPSFYVKSEVSGLTLTEGPDDDYTVTWDKAGKSEFKDVAVYTLTVDGVGNYAGRKSQTYEIKKNTPELTVAMEGWFYGETAKEPVVTKSPWVDGDESIVYAVKKSEGSYVDEDWSATKPSSAGTYVVKAIVDATANYEGKFAIDEFTIELASIEIAVSANVVYTAERQAPTLTVKNTKNNEVVMTEGSDYTVEWKNPKGETFAWNAESEFVAAGTYTVSVTGINNYTGTKTTTYIIAPAAIQVAISADVDYTGAVQEPTVTVKSGETVNGGNTVLVENTDYTVSWNKAGKTEFKDAADYVVTVTGMGNYTGEIERTYKIKQAPENAVTITMAGWTYGETAKDPDPNAVFHADGEPSITYAVKKSGDYAESDWSSIKPSTAGTYVVKATVAETANYVGGSATAEFTIAPAAIQIALSENKTYNGLALTPTLTVKSTIDESAVLIAGEDKDYVVTWDKTGFVNAGSYTVTVSGKNNYKGTEIATYTIAKATQNDVTVAMSDWTYGETATSPTVTADFAAESEPSITYAVKKTGDYVESDWSSVKPFTAGTYVVKATVAETSNYVGGSATAEFTIAQAKIPEIALSATGATYNGEEQKPVVTVTFNGNALVAGTDYTIDWGEGNWTDVGTYTVKVTGKGNFSGEQTAEFNINKKAVTITVANASKTYGNEDPEFTGTVVGLVNASDLGIVSYSRSGVGQSAGTYTDSLVVSYTDNSNYAITVKNGTFIIDRAEVTVTADALTKQYNTADPDTLTTEIKGLVNGEARTLIDFTIVREAGENVGTYAVTLTGAENQDNYHVTYVPASFTITQNQTNEVTVAMDGWTYTGSAEKSPVTNATFKAEGEPAITYVKKGTEDWSATVPVNAGTYVVRATVKETANYVGGFATAEFTIAPAAIQIALSENKIYNGLAQTPTLTVKSSINETAVLIASEDKDYVVTWDKTGFVNAGSYTVTVVGQGNYTGTKTATYTIAKATQNDVTVAMSDWTYGETATSPTVTADFAAESEPSITYAVKKTGDYVESDWSSVKPFTAGTYVVKATVAETSNYVGGSATAEFTIAQAKIPEIALSATGATYNGEEQKPVVTVTFNGNALVADADYTIDWGEGAWTNAGTYTVKVKGQGNFSGEQTAEFTIGRKAVTVTAVAAGKVFGTTDPTLTATVEGLVKDETISYTVGRASGENVGIYAITPSGASEQGSYSITYNAADFTITTATIPEITLSADVTYNGTEQKPSVTLTVSDTALVADADYTIDWGEGAWTASGTYTVKVTGKGNFSGEQSAEFTIGKKPVVVSAEAKSKTYGSADPELTVSIVGLVNG